MVDKVTNVTTYTASGSAFVFGLTANEVAALGALAIAILSYLTNLYFKIREARAGSRQSVIDELARQGLIDRRVSRGEPKT